MKSTRKQLSIIVLTATSLAGCSIYNDVQDIRMLVNYDVGNDSFFNSTDGSQYIVAPNRKEGTDRVLVCYQNSGVFSSTDEMPLRNVANEWLTIKHPDMISTSSNNASGVWEARTCYEFDYENKQTVQAISNASGAYVYDYQDDKEEQQQPIGAFLNEETGEVVVVGESS